MVELMGVMLVEVGVGWICVREDEGVDHHHCHCPLQQAAAVAARCRTIGVTMAAGGVVVLGVGVYIKGQGQGGRMFEGIAGRGSGVCVVYLGGRVVEEMHLLLPLAAEKGAT